MLDTAVGKMFDANKVPYAPKLTFGWTGFSGKERARRKKKIKLAHSVRMKIRMRVIIEIPAHCVGCRFNRHRYCTLYQVKLDMGKALECKSYSTVTVS